MPTPDNPNVSIRYIRFPAISVIIPLYNAESYIGQCLNSILAQTFKNFEVIVVDDCSTDNSVQVVESYREKFGERLTLIKKRRNSGGGFGPRNVGLTVSRGEYIYFVDADDFISKTALEVLYTAAKNFDADVVYTGARYLYTTDGGAILKFDKIARTLKEKKLEDKPTLTVNDPNKIFKDYLLDNTFFWAPWTKFVKRDFLTENEIVFPEITFEEDFLWSLELFARAEKFLRIPNAVYFWRDDSSNSVIRDKKSVASQIAKWIEAIVLFSDALKDLTDKLDILRDNPDYCYMTLVRQFNFCFEHNFGERLQVKPLTVYKILQRQFDDKSGSFEFLLPFMFSVIDSQQKSLIRAQQQFEKFNQFAAQSKARIAELESEVNRLKQQE